MPKQMKPLSPEVLAAKAAAAAEQKKQLMAHWAIEDAKKLEDLKASQIKEVNDDAEVPADVKAQVIAIINTATVADMDKSNSCMCFTDKFSAPLVAIYEAHGL